jgi:hypothetical protein
MTSKKRHPQWWQLYIGLPLLVGLFWSEMQLPLTPTENIIAQLGILILIFGFVQLWLHANRSALMGLDEEEGKWEFRVYQIPPGSLGTFDDVEVHPMERPLLQIPAGGIKGVLSDTFEWETPEDGSSVYADQRAVSRKE